MSGFSQAATRILEKTPGGFTPPLLPIIKKEEFSTIKLTTPSPSRVKYILIVCAILMVFYIILSLPWTYTQVGHLLNKIGLHDTIDGDNLAIILPIRNIMLHGLIFFILASLVVANYPTS